MAAARFVSYLRVTTRRQGDSGLGLDAQRKAVTDYLDGGRWDLIAEVVEVESGKRADRPKLAEALRLCRVHGATLVVAKLDRLARDAHFLLGLSKAGVEFVACDMPSANRMTVGIMAVVAEEEARMISARTRAALASKRDFYAKLTDEQRAELRAAGKATQLGGDRGHMPTIAAQGHAASLALRQGKARERAADLLPVIAEIRAAGATSLQAVADVLNSRGITTARGGAWSPKQVSRIEVRAA